MKKDTIGMPINEIKTMRRSVKLVCSDPSLTKQEYGDAAEINNIMRKYRVTGMLPMVKEAPVYADVSELPDYASALRAVDEAKEAFMQLPSEVRAKFGNDPGVLLDWISDPRNRSQAAELGFLPKEKKEAGDGQGTVASNTLVGAGSGEGAKKAPNPEPRNEA